MACIIWHWGMCNEYVLSVLLQFMDSDYPFGILKLYLVQFEMYKWSLLSELFFPSKLYIGEIYYFFVHYAEFFFDSTKHLSHGHFACKKSLKIPKGLSGTVTRRTGDSMAKEKGQKDKQRSTKHDT